MSIKTSRRGFLKGAAGLSALGIAGFGHAAARIPSGKIRLAAVGVMGKGYSDWMPIDIARTATAACIWSGVEIVIASIWSLDWSSSILR